MPKKTQGPPPEAPPAEQVETTIETPIQVQPGDRGFERYGISPEVVEALALRNINDTFAIQALVLQDAIEGRDVLAKSRTGSGKTLAFALPIVERLQHDSKGPGALIMVPTRELTSQVAEEFRMIADVKKLRVATVYGGVGIQDQAKKAAKADIVIATPGRLLDLYRRKLLQLNRVRICILDEADRMLDMGFLPDVDYILSLLPEERQTMLFSATLDGEIARLAARFTNQPVRHEIVDARPIIESAVHRFIPVAHSEKTPALIRELAGDRGMTLIFVSTKRMADQLARILKDEGFGAQPLHGDMSQVLRERALARFASGKGDVLVATDVAARGLDLEHITHVINYDPPNDDKGYVHRIGRTARAGRSGTGITLVTPDQRGEVSRMAARLKLHVEFQDAGMKVLPPQKVFTGGRGRSRLMSPPRRRKF